MRYGCRTKRALPFAANSPDGTVGKNCVCAIFTKIIIHSTTAIQFRNKVNKYDYVLTLIQLVSRNPSQPQYVSCIFQLGINTI